MKYQLILALVLVSLLFSACSAGNAATPTAEAIPTVIADTTIIAEGRLEPVRYAEIAFTASGVISEVLVDAGAAVTQGQPLIRLGDEADTQYAAAQLELVSTQKALNDLQNSAGTDFAQAIIDLKEAQEEFNKAEDYLKYLQNDKKVPQTEIRRRTLVKTWTGFVYETKTRHFKGPAPLDWIIDAENELRLRKAELDTAQRAYDRLKDGVDKDELAVLEARLNAAKAEVASFFVTAPFDGVVANLNAKTGNSINAGETAVTVADFSDWVVNTTDLTEIDVVSLKEGQEVSVTLDALPGVELKGTILSIGQIYAENQGDIVYEVAIVLNETDPDMRWGMTAAVKFDSQE
jgi:HlyD family secretion protein